MFDFSTNTVQSLQKGGDKIIETIYKTKKTQSKNTVYPIIYSNVVCDGRKGS